MEKEKDGVWRTIRGRRIFIASGESLGQAMAKSGKFKREDVRLAKSGLSIKDHYDKAEPKSLQERQKANKKIHNKANRYTITKFQHGEQAEKNQIFENAPTKEEGKTRVERNVLKYSDTDKRELRHEELQKKLADYKAKKQSNNKIEPKETIEDLSKLSRSELNEYDRGHTYKDSNVADYVRNKTLYQEGGLQRHYDAMKEAERKYNESKQSNNKTIHTQSGDYSSNELKQRDNEIKQLYKDTWEGKTSYKELNDKLEDLKKNGKVSQGELDSLKYDASLETGDWQNNPHNANRSEYIGNNKVKIKEELSQIKVKGENNIIPRDFKKAYGRFKVNSTANSENKDDRFEITKDEYGTYHAKNLRTGQVYTTFLDHLRNNNVFEFENNNSKKETINNYKRRKGK